MEEEEEEERTEGQTTKFVVHCKKEKYDIYIGRPHPTIPGAGEHLWGNPFIIGKDGTRGQVIEKYREWLLEQPSLVEKAKKELKGKVLGCWCAPQSCHGDVLAEIVNDPRKEREDADEEEMMDELGDKIDKKTEDKARSKRRTLETREVSKILFAEVNKKRTRTVLKQDSMMAKHVEKGASCYECGQNMSVLGRSYIVPCLCHDCEHSTLELVRAQRRRKTSTLEEQQILRSLGEKAEAKSRKEFESLREDSEKVWKICEACMGGDREEVKQCSAYTCERFGERYKLKTELEKSVQRISATHGIDPTTLLW